MGKAFFVITLLVLPVLVPPHSPPACRDLVPDQCQAIPLSEFCRGRHQHCSCSQICKDLNNHLPRHKKAPNSLGTLACWYIWACAPGRGSLPEAYLPEPQSLGSHRIPLPPTPRSLPVFRLPGCRYRRGVSSHGACLHLPRSHNFLFIFFKMTAQKQTTEGREFSGETGL